MVNILIIRCMYRALLSWGDKYRLKMAIMTYTSPHSKLCQKNPESFTRVKFGLFLQYPLTHIGQTPLRSESVSDFATAINPLCIYFHYLFNDALFIKFIA